MQERLLTVKGRACRRACAAGLCRRLGTGRRVRGTWREKGPCGRTRQGRCPAALPCAVGRERLPDILADTALLTLFRWKGLQVGRREGTSQWETMLNWLTAG